MIYLSTVMRDVLKENGKRDEDWNDNGNGNNKYHTSRRGDHRLTVESARKNTPTKAVYAISVSHPS